jgi:hypothetical protein
MIQSVAAEQQHIARKHLVLAGVDIDEEVAAERTAENVTQRRVRGFLGGQQPQAGLVLRDGVIPGERPSMSRAEAG